MLVAFWGCRSEIAGCTMVRTESDSGYTCHVCTVRSEKDDRSLPCRGYSMGVMVAGKCRVIQ